PSFSYLRCTPSSTTFRTPSCGTEGVACSPGTNAPVQVANVSRVERLIHGKQALTYGVRIKAVHVQCVLDGVVLRQAAAHQVFDCANPVSNDLGLLRQVALVARLAVARHDHVDIQLANPVERLQPLPGISLLDERLALVEHVITSKCDAFP